MQFTASCVHCGQTKRVCCSTSTRLLRDGTRHFVAPQCAGCCQAPSCAPRVLRAKRLAAWGL